MPPDQAKFRRSAVQRILTGQYKEDDWDARTYPANLALVKKLAENSG